MYIYVCVYIYIYIYTYVYAQAGRGRAEAAIYTQAGRGRAEAAARRRGDAAIAQIRPISVLTNIMDFRWFDSSILFTIRGGIPRPKGDFPESLSQAILVEIMLVG